MDWTRAIDAYCERTDASFWSEPVNAVTNLAFIVAAIVMWHRARGEVPAQVLCAVLFLIGVGSFLFHTFATAWAAAADTTPILVFSLIYIFLANRDYWGWPWWWAGIGALAFMSLFGTAYSGLCRLAVLRHFQFLLALAVADRGLCRLVMVAPSAHGAGVGAWRGDFVSVADRAVVGPGPLRGFPAGHAFSVAHPECGDAGLDDRGLAAAQKGGGDVKRAALKPPLSNSVLVVQRLRFRKGARRNRPPARSGRPAGSGTGVRSPATWMLSRSEWKKVVPRRPPPLRPV